MNLDERELLSEWYRRVVLSSQGHYNNAQRLGRYHLALGIPASIIVTGVGTSVFATLEKNVETNIRILVGIISIFAAVLACLQTLFNFSERAERHKIYGARYSSLRRKLEMALVQENISDDGFKRLSEDIARHLDTLGEEAPHIPSKVWFKTEERYKNRFKAKFPFSGKPQGT